MIVLKKIKQQLLGRFPQYCFVASQVRVGLFVPAFFEAKKMLAHAAFFDSKKSSTAIPNAILSNNYSFQSNTIFSKNQQYTNRFLLLIVLFFGLSKSIAQDKYLAAANSDFNEKKYEDAEANYRISASKNPKKALATYNLGNAIYRINQPQEAALAYSKSITETKLRPEKHQAFHNIGNTAMKLKDYTNAVNAYKQALINNPADDETRYNYALAKKLLKDNPPKKDDKKKDKDKDKDKNKDKDKDKDKDKKDENKDKKDGEGDKPKPQPQQPKPEGGGISKQRLENLLDAVNNEEKKVQEKVNKNKQKTKPQRAEKDW